MRYVVDLADLNRHAVGRVGGKNANLGELLNSGIRVPPGFAVTVDAYVRHLEDAGLHGKIHDMLARLHSDDVTSLDAVSAQIRSLIVQHQVPAEISDELRDRYRALEGLCGRADVPVAVRSSATAEDRPDASFAGQQDTYLWVEGEDGVIERVGHCWASLFNARAISYRIANAVPHEKVSMSVTVQKMVNSRAAGVMFTLDPQNGDVSQVLVEGNWGLGESVASGEVTPDQFKVDKISNEINSRVVSCKHVECVPDPDGGMAAMVSTPEDRQRAPCIADGELRELVRIARLIENHYGCAQDIEWAIDRDLPFPENVFIVQTRPETVWSRRKSEPLLAGKSASELLLQRALQTVKFG